MAAAIMKGDGRYGGWFNEGNWDCWVCMGEAASWVWAAIAKENVVAKTAASNAAAVFLKFVTTSLGFYVDKSLVVNVSWLN